MVNLRLLFATQASKIIYLRNKKDEQSSLFIFFPATHILVMVAVAKFNILLYYHILAIARVY